MRTMDRKIAERRHHVTEQRAANRLRGVIFVVSLIGLAAAAFWLVRSPLLAIDRVTINGAQHSAAAAVVERLGVIEGTPTVSVDADAVERALLADPWIAEAAVVVTWPGSVDVEVTEHVPIAVIQLSEGFAHVTASGHVVELLNDAAGRPLILIQDPGQVRPGNTIGAASLTGALEFVSGLSPGLQSVTVVSIADTGLLTATVGEYEVRLGRPIDMASKAAALMAIIDYGVEPGSQIDVTAARRPAVANPQAEVEGEG